MSTYVSALYHLTTKENFQTPRSSYGDLFAFYLIIGTPVDKFQQTKTTEHNI